MSKEDNGMRKPGRKRRMESIPVDQSKGNMSFREARNSGVGLLFPSEADALRPGMVLNGEWVLVRYIGRGHVGDIWEGKHVKRDQKVVVKFIPRDIFSYQTELNSIRRIFDQVRSLDHPVICPVHAFANDAEAGWYYVTGWTEGKTLAEYFREAGTGKAPLTIEQSLQVVESLSDALDHAFSKGLVHNDVKPSRILLRIGPDGRVETSLTDFGMAAGLRHSSMRISLDLVGMSGISPYMAPEQWRSRQLNGKTDQYAVAAIAYQLFSGQRPFTAVSFDELRDEVLETKPREIPNVPDNINCALRKALAKRVDDRFASCNDFAKALRDPAYRDTRPWGKVCWGVIAVTAAAILAGAMLFYLFG